MSDFHKTRMGHTFYEHTMPELVRQLERLGTMLEQLAEHVAHSAGNRSRQGGDDAE